MNVLLDEGAFEQAATDLKTLAEDIAALKASIEAELQRVQTGFNTPAGRKFQTAYAAMLMKPMEDQGLVVEHIATTLATAKDSYQAVFTEFQTLNTLIESFHAH